MSLFLLSFFEIGNAIGPPSKQVKFSQMVVDDDHDQFTPDALRAYIYQLGIKHPDVVYAQAILETGNFSSRIFKENNNLFGMKYVDTVRHKRLGARYRPTVAIGEQYEHAKYKDWRKSVEDYLLWQQQFKRTPIETERQYLYLLDQRYAVRGKYVKVLNVVLYRVRVNYYDKQNS